MTLALTIKIGDGPVHDMQVPVSIEAIEAAYRGEVIEIFPPQNMPITLIGWNVGGRVE